MKRGRWPVAGREATMPNSESGSMYSHYEENEKNHGDPRGRGPRTPEGGHHGQELDMKCPFCGEPVANKLHVHLPCDGGEDGA